MTNTKTKIVAIVGPTASGKTDIAISVAEHFSGEVISADSRQVYRSLDIGTAKVTPEETRGVAHHLIDVVEPEEVYTAADFVRDGRQAITDIISRHHLPIIAGGTFFYLDALLGKISLPDVPPNPTLRAELEKKDPTDLFAALEKLDPARAATIEPDNTRRLVRALEIIAATGGVPTNTSTESPYQYLTIALLVPKDILRERFAARATTWLAGGFQAEVEGLLARGVTRERLQEIGFEYTLMLEYMDSKLDQAAFVQKFVEKNWQYAKRQLTWLKRDKHIVWEQPENREAIFRHIDTFLRS